MSTRSRIGIQLSSGHILSVYHHWDGYPSGLGAQLVRDFTTFEQISEVIDQGDMSCIGSPYTDQDCPPKLHENIKEYFECTFNCGGQYCYLFDKNNQWKCYAIDYTEDNQIGFKEINLKEELNYV